MVIQFLASQNPKGKSNPTEKRVRCLTEKIPFFDFQKRTPIKIKGQIPPVYLVEQAKLQNRAERKSHLSLALFSIASQKVLIERKIKKVSGISTYPPKPKRSTQGVVHQSVQAIIPRCRFPVERVQS